MKNFVNIIMLLFVVVLFSCDGNEDTRIAGFEDVNDLTIYDYLVQNEEFSSFLSIAKKGGIDKTLSAYNPNAADYTLFLPDNDAINEFINQNEQFSSLDDLLNDQEYVSSFSRFHVLNLGVHTNEFPFGTFSNPTLSYDYLTVSFIIESDSSYYKINNQAAVVGPNIEVSNGYIHIIQSVLEPVIYTTYGWLENNSEFSIFKDAVDIIGTESIINVKLKELGQEYNQPITLLLESDDIYKANGINSIDDLVQLISPDDADYTSTSNLLYNYVAYHVLTSRYFINDFEEVAENYNTYSDIPLNINGTGIDIVINKGKQVYDTLVVNKDTTIIDYVGFLYDESNVITQSGVIHFIDRMMEQQKPSRSIKTFEFKEEPIIEEYLRQSGLYQIKEEDPLTRLEWTGSDLYVFKTNNEDYPANNGDHLLLNGDFTISYTVPKIVQGKYNLILRVESFSSGNALVEVYVDGSKIGGLLDLTSGGSSIYPFQNKTIGNVDFRSYKEHKVEVRALIPGSFNWDFIRFEPI